MKPVDASVLPSGSLDYRAPIWWGNLLLLAIETTMFALMVACYLYYRQNIEPWPPPRARGEPPHRFDPNPSLLLPTVGLAVLLASGATAYVGDVAAKAMDRAGILRWDGLTLLLGGVALVLRFFELDALHFRWDENAYASIVWLIVGTHLLHLLVVILEVGNTWVWIRSRGLDKKHATDALVSTVYWYWVVGTWVLLYGLVYLLPRAI